MVLKAVYFRPVFIPVEHLNRIIVRTRQDIGESWVDNYVADVVTVILDCFEFLSGIVVVDSEFCVVGAYNNPLLTCDKFCTSHGRVCNFERTDLALSVVIENGNISNVKSYQDPGKGRM